MNRWISSGAIVLMAGLATPSFGQFGGMNGARGLGRSSLQNFGSAGADALKASQVCPVKIVSADGKTTTGTLRLTTVVVACSFGVYEIKPDKVQEIRLSPHSNADPAVMGASGLQRPGSIATVSGEVIEGTVLIPSWWRVETDLGLLAPNSEGLKSISFVKSPENAPPPADNSPPPPVGRSNQPPSDQPVSIPLPGSIPPRPFLPPA